MQPNAEIKMVLFDMDGLLLDTERLYTVATQKILDRFGFEYTYDVKSKLMGRVAADAAQYLVRHYGIEDKLSGPEFSQELSQNLEEMLPECKVLPGVEKLLLHLKKHGIPMAVATSSTGSRFQMKTRRHRDLFDRVFELIVTGDQVTNSKPHPEIFLKAFDLLKAQKSLELRTDNVLVFEDAPLGVDSAMAAQMNVVMVNDQVETTSAHQLIKSMSEFDPSVWGLPAYD